ncbi:MAG: cell division protein FtsQ [Bacteroidaceae bacterium]|nr:cell division protein FtsQ [Bacteroidaceae bacterium]
MIKKVLLTLLVLLFGFYFVAAITVLNRTNDNLICQEVNLAVSDSVRAGFVSSQQIEQILLTNNLYPKGKALKEINTQQIEKLLQSNPFISQAVCYRSAADKICVSATQRLPILRMISEHGDDFYIDANGHLMKPSATTYAAHLVVVTGNLSAAYAINHLLPLGKILQNDLFWNNMIEQIHITEKGNVELVPRIGDHIINIGKPENYQDKLYRLRVFYEKGLNKIGWNKYTRIDLEFENQIVCTRKQ